MNFNDEVQRNRLFKALEHSYRRLEPFRRLVRGLVEEYAGSGYGPAKNRYESLMNLMNQAVDAYTMSLVANRPRVVIETTKPNQSYFARHFAIAVNNLIQEIDLESTLRQAVLDAFFCMGIVKIHLADSAPVMLEENLWMDPGSPYASCVSLENWVHDTNAGSWREVKFAGDGYRIPFEDLKSDLYDQSVVEELSPTSKSRSGDDERLAQISKGYDTDDDELEPMIDLMDIWIPRDKKIYTFAMDSGYRFTGKFGPIAEMPWDGPEFGPYHLLSFNDVPGNIVPTSPAAQMSALARLANSIMRKQARRAKIQKDVTAYTPSGAEGAKKINRTDDQGMVEVEDPSQIGVLKFGGIDPQTQGFLLGVIEMFDRMAGNLPAMLGLGSAAETATQEAMVRQAASKKEAQMQYKVLEFTRGIVVDLAHLLWNDQMKVLPGRMPIDGADGYSVDATWTPDDRQGSFADYKLSIDVYSMPYQSPSQKVQALNALITQIYGPLGQMLLQQGGQINMQKLTDIYAERLGDPRIREIIQFNAVEPEGGMGEPPGMPAVTTREHIRRNIPTGGTNQSRSSIAQQAWIDQAGQSNQSQQVSLARSPA
jgi:hypothetical protein